MDNTKVKSKENKGGQMKPYLLPLPAILRYTPSNMATTSYIGEAGPSRYKK
jgi:hypothetical protein